MRPVCEGRNALIIRFTKMHGAGNDFVMLDLRSDPALAALFVSNSTAACARTSALCRVLADRHTGVGCDQVITIDAPRTADALASYGIWNADGSASGQCGNGARCVAAYVMRSGTGNGPITAERFALDSPVGTHEVQVLGDGQFRVAMGVPQFQPARVPLHGVAHRDDTYQDDYAINIDGTRIAFGAVSLGNPHAVLEVDDVAAAPVATLGVALQRSGAFPQSANVGFAQVLAHDRIALRVYERGAGETLACGSGACAAVAVLARRGRIGRDVDVELPGGTLRITWPADDASMQMAGPAAFVFEGTMDA